jgi:ammonium transporter, Amt family
LLFRIFIHLVDIRIDINTYLPFQFDHSLVIIRCTNSIVIMNDNATQSSIHNEGDNAWMMTSTVLVLLMTPALAFFYGGLVDHKNVLNQLFLSFACMGIVFVQWVLVGFSFAFGPPVSPGFGSFEWAVLRIGEADDSTYTPTYPLLTFAAYQGTFAIITPALISGSIVGRMKLVPYMIFILIWTTVCYDPMAHWVWGSNGWLKTLGALDFAGGTVVHILSGVSGFVASIILGKRHDYGSTAAAGHNLPFTILGTSLLWVGWSGFNAGSANEAR